MVRVWLGPRWLHQEDSAVMMVCLSAAAAKPGVNLKHERRYVLYYRQSMTDPVPGGYVLFS